MNRFALRHAVRSTTRPVERPTNVCVVDPQLDHYSAWRELATAGQMRLTLLDHPEEALRMSRATAMDLWVINTHLPVLSGFELCGMLRSRSSSRTTICLVADEYSTDAERNAWDARATMFLCKGEHTAWLADWLRNRSRPSPQSDQTVGLQMQA